MKFTKVSTRVLFGGLLGLCLASFLAEICSQALYDIFSTSTFFRTVTGYSPNAIAEWLYKISWALLFCAGWWMLWNFDHFFIPVIENPVREAEETQNVYASSSDVKDDETFKPESEEEPKQEDQENTSKNEHSETCEDTEEETSESNGSFDIQDEKFLQVLKIDNKSTQDFASIKSIYRKRIAQYHPDKVSAMGPEIREVAEQKAKEINEAYEHFRKKFSS